MGRRKKRGLGGREVTRIAERRKDPEQREKEPSVGSTKPREKKEERPDWYSCLSVLTLLVTILFYASLSFNFNSLFPLFLTHFLFIYFCLLFLKNSSSLYIVLFHILRGSYQ